jgi:predicted ATPase
MKLHLENIGKVSSASIQIDGITIIAGENNTGKSTVGKSLFAVFNSFYNIDKHILNERVDSVINQLSLSFRNYPGNYYRQYDLDEWVKELIVITQPLLSDSEALKKTIYSTIMHYDDVIVRTMSESDMDQMIEAIGTILKISDDEIFRSVLQHKLDAEFGEQTSNVFADNDLSCIQLTVQNEPIDINIHQNTVVSVSRRINLGTEAIYMDDPFVLDEVPNRIWRQSSRYSDHRTHLKEKIYFSRRDPNVVEEIVVSKKFKSIYALVSSVCAGDVVRGKRATWNYRISGTDKALEIKNISTGLKTFAIIKKLLTNGYIESNGTIILDEPEIHLHPEWQLVFAELIVLLHKEFGLHILINTHSPYFLNAIEVYASKYDIANKCKYYLAQNNGAVSYTEDVTNNIELIYAKLAKPFQDLENARYDND